MVSSRCPTEVDGAERIAIRSNGNDDFGRIRQIEKTRLAEIRRRN